MDPSDRLLIDHLQRQLRDLAEANASLTRRVFTLETEVSRISGVEVVAAPPAPSPPVVHAAPPPLPAMAPPAPEPPPAAAQGVYEDHGLPVGPPPATAATPPLEPSPSETPTIESNVGLTWINRIGAVTVMFGVAFFFKYAVDNDWIGPSGRVMLGVLTGMLAIWGGDRLWHRNQKIFAQGIQAVGSAMLYLSFFAAFSFYQLIPQGAAFVLMFATSMMTGALSLRYNARATLLLALLSGYATPFMLSKGEPNDLFFLSYMLVLNGGAAVVARMRGWKSVEAVALVGTWFLHSAWCADRARIFGRTWAAVFTGLNYGVMAMSPNWWTILISQFAASVALGIAYEHQWGEAPFLMLALFFAGLAVTWLKKVPGGPAVALAGYWFGQAVLGLRNREQHLTELMAWYTIVFAATLAWAWLRATADHVYKSDLLTAAASGVIYYGASYALLEGEYKAYLGLFTVAVAASYLALGYLLYSGMPEEKRDTAGPLLAAGLALAFLALAVPIQLTGYRITIGWAIQAAALTWIAYKLRDWRILIGSAILAFLAVMRLTGVDSLLYWPPLPNYESYTLLFNPRFISFFCVSLSLFLTAYWTSKMENVPRKLAGIPYVLAHLLMLWGIHLELFAYIDSRVDLTSQSSIKTLVSSLIFAGYGFQFLASGFARRSAFPRILGLILFAIVIVKLYIYDIWLLEVTYRMIAFIALGGMLLAGSYLYSRFRDKLSTLIKDE